jgi:hypothetical protein
MSTCTAADDTCIGLVSNQGQTTFGLRMAEIDFTTPAKLASGLVAMVVGDAAQADVPSCNLMGEATFNWLLQFDTTTNTLKTGGAKPVADPTAGYSFDDEMLMNGNGQLVQVSPITLSATVSNTGTFSVTTGQDVIIPVFLAANASSYVLLPLRQARITMGTLSSNNDCIGTYNAAGLQAASDCLPDQTHPLYIDGGALDGFMTLADADSVEIAPLKQSLCYVLSGETTGTVNPNTGVTGCLRSPNNESGTITYMGDWCSTTNSAASPSCADAVQLQANFAAASVKINN